jgi:hypothetical protein
LLQRLKETRFMPAAPDEISNAVKQGFFVPVVGAGVSISVGGPSWIKYLKNMAVGLDKSFEKLCDHTDASDLTEIASLLQWERPRLGLAPIRVDTTVPGSLHRTLARWNCRLYLTTNFDDLLEQALRDLVGKPHVLYNDELEHLDLNALFRAGEGSWQPTVVKLCSSLQQKNPGAVSKEDFARLIWGENSALDLILTVLRTCTVTFIACGMNDPLLNAGIDKCFAAKLGHPKSYAFLPYKTSQSRLKSLEARGVTPIKVLGDDKTEGLEAILNSCALLPPGRRHLLMFEPGVETKLKQLLLAIERFNSDRDSVSIVGLISTRTSLIAQAQQWGALQSPQVQIVPFQIRDTQRTSDILDKLFKRAVEWNAIVTPYEYATRDLAEFARQYDSRMGGNLIYHPVATANLSRNKTQFKWFLRERFANDPILAPTSFEEIDLGFETTWTELLEKIEKSEPASKSREVVIKPIDAASSTGVRRPGGAKF